ncbi:MAG: hypothetical protein R2795_25120 [Saprospiraceae bacterium]
MLDIIKSYIKSETDEYGLLINGKWGHGKTYFIENILPNEIESLEIFYVSVNGMNSTSELHRAIISKAMVNHLSLDRFLSFGSRASKAIKAMPKALAVLDSLSFSDFHFPHQILVVIDDLERIPESYSYGELFGYISRTFLSKPKFKTILIGDISRPRIISSEFRIIKEKYIKWIIDFESDFKVVLDDMVAKYKKEKSFNFIVKNKETIQDLFRRNDIRNYRTLGFFLEVCSTVGSVLNDKYNDLSNSIILFIFIFSVEYKLGHTDYFDGPDNLPPQVKTSGSDNFLYAEIIFDKINKMTGAVEEAPKKAEEPQQPLDVFIKSFESYSREDPNNDIGYKGEYHFFRSLYVYITTGKLDSPAFLAECENLSNYRQRNQEEEVRERVDEDVSIMTQYKTLSFVELSQAIERFLQRLPELNIADAIRGFSFLFYFAESELVTHNSEDLEQTFNEYIEGYNFEEGLSLQQKTSGVNFRMLSPTIWEGRREAYDTLIEKYNAYKHVLQKESAELKLQNWGSSLILDTKIVFRYCAADQIADRVLELLDNRDFIEQLEGEFESEFNFLHANRIYPDLLEKLERLSLRFGETLEDKTVDRIDLFFLRSFKRKIDTVAENIRTA